MKAPLDKTSENKSQITNNKATQPLVSGDGLTQFKDNRPETVQLQQLQGMANNSKQVNPLNTPLKTSNSSTAAQLHKAGITDPSSKAIQLKQISGNKLNVAGETHKESDLFRNREEMYAKDITGGVYKSENAFIVRSWAGGNDQYGDPKLLRAEMLLAMIREQILPKIQGIEDEDPAQIKLGFRLYRGGISDNETELADTLSEVSGTINSALGQITVEAAAAVRANDTSKGLTELVQKIRGQKHTGGTDLVNSVNLVIGTFAREVLLKGNIRSEAVVMELRSKAMHEAADMNAKRWVGEIKGVWKVGNDHVPEIKAEKKNEKYTLLDKGQFNTGFVAWMKAKKIKEDKDKAADDEYPK